jgi:hypothetical protein
MRSSVHLIAPRWRTYLAWPLGLSSLGLAQVSVLAAQAGEQLEGTSGVRSDSWLPAP